MNLCHALQKFRWLGAIYALMAPGVAIWLRSPVLFSQFARSTQY